MEGDIGLGDCNSERRGSKDEIFNSRATKAGVEN
jgi:hypothetical protein